MKFGTWHFRIGMNRRGKYKPRWFWLLLFGILVAELLYNLISILIHAPINALMILLLTPMVAFIWSRLWFVIELRTGSVSDRGEFSAFERAADAEREEAEVEDPAEAMQAPSPPAWQTPSAPQSKPDSDRPEEPPPRPPRTPGGYGI